MPPRLTAALGSDRSRWQSPDELLCFSRIAPIIERSGKQFRIRWRYFCPKFFRQTFHEFAAQSIQDSFWARAYYYSQRARAQRTPRRGPRARFQVDAHHLEVLADPHPL
jgi:Transposase IS116/IS110/IS902 family